MVSSPLKCVNHQPQPIDLWNKYVCSSWLSEVQALGSPKRQQVNNMQQQQTFFDDSTDSTDFTDSDQTLQTLHHKQYQTIPFMMSVVGSKSDHQTQCFRPSVGPLWAKFPVPPRQWSNRHWHLQQGTHVCTHSQFAVDLWNHKFDTCAVTQRVMQVSCMFSCLTITHHWQKNTT